MLKRCGLLLALQMVLAPAAAAAEDTNQLEREFQRMLTGAVLEGFFSEDGAADKPLKRDRYTIAGLEKLSGDLWLFKARIQYGEKDLTVPIPLHVKWAGDTPVISMTDFVIPGLGTFTARVLFYRDHYAGTWSGTDHGGKLFGRVLRDDSKRQAAAAPESLEPFATGNWGSFRGLGARGIAEGSSLPVEWDVEQGTNVLWKTSIPGLAHSSPVIWGDRIFVTTAVRLEEPAELRVGLYGDVGSVEDEGEHDFLLYCLDRRTGEELWSELVKEGVPRSQRHPKGSHAASSPATDGKHVVACFGSEGLYGFDVEGNLLWERDLGVLDAGFFMMPSAQWGFASSPVIHDGRVILQVDVLEEAYLLALDVATGEELWRTEREDVPTWSTPTVLARGERSQVVCNGFEQIGGYDLATGRELWTLSGGGDIPVPTPIASRGLIFITSAHGKLAPIYAIHDDAEGELSMDPEECSFLSWRERRKGNYMQTPLVHGDHLYLCNDAGILSCYVAATGKQVYRHRLGSGRSGFSASLVAGDGKLYATSEEGSVHVLRLGPEFEELAINEMNETCMATPAISRGHLFFRTRHHLIAIGASKDEEAGGGNTDEGR